MDYKKVHKNTDFVARINVIKLNFEWVEIELRSRWVAGIADDTLPRANVISQAVLSANPNVSQKMDRTPLLLP